MNSQLLAIGFRPEDPQQLFTFLSVAAEQSRPVLGDMNGMEHRLWVCPSGAALSVHLNRGRIEAMVPWFESDTVWPAEIKRTISDTTTMHWSGVELDFLGGFAASITVQIRDFSAWKPELVCGRKLPLQMAVFGEDVQIFPDSGSFWQGQREFWGPNELGEYLELPETFILPTGRAADGGGHEGMASLATALIAGRIIQAELRENSITRKGFRVVQADVGGFNTEVTFWKTRDGREPEPGQIMLAHCWLSGTPVNVPPPPAEKVNSRSWIRRIWG